MASLFSTVTRYVRTVGADPRENILTQALAATLVTATGENGQSLAHRLVEAWLNGDPEASAVRGPEIGTAPRIEPQRHLPAGYQIDLELVFPDAAGNTEWLIWVEVKDCAGLSGDDQLKNYMTELEKRDARHTRLVFLSPAGYPLRPEDAPPSLIKTDWQRVGEVVEGWVSEQRQGSAQAWIGCEFIEYLNERVLMAEPLRREHLEQLKAAASAERAFEALLRRADQDIYARLDPEGIPHGNCDDDFTLKRGPLWPEAWRGFGCSDLVISGHPELTGRDVWFAWCVWVPDGKERSEIGAGVSFRNPPAEDVSRRLEGEGLSGVVLDHFNLHQGFWYWPLDELLDDHRDVNSQATAIADFVIDRFQRARRALGLQPSQ